MHSQTEILVKEDILPFVAELRAIKEHPVVWILMLTQQEPRRLPGHRFTSGDKVRPHGTLVKRRSSVV